MTDLLTYMGYTAKIEFDAEDRIFFGRLAGIDDGVSFHADTVDELVAAFEESVDDYIETCAKIGKKPEKAYSGKLMLRVDPELHAGLAIAAAQAGVSLNQYGAAALRRDLAARSAARRAATPGGTDPDVVTARR